MSQFGKHFKKRSGLGLAVAVALASTGCSTVEVDAVQESQKSEIENAQRIFKQGMKVSGNESMVSVSDGYYIAEDPYYLNERELLPDFFHYEDSFSQLDPLSFQDLLSVISDEYDVRIEFTDDAAEHMVEFSEGGDDESNEQFSGDDALQNGESLLVEDLVAQEVSTEGLPGSQSYFTINHSGSLSQLLDKVTGKVGLYWEFKNKQVTIFRTQSAQFNADVTSISNIFTASFSSNSGQDNSESSSSVDYEYNDGVMVDADGSGGSFVATIQSMMSNSENASVQVIPRLNMVTIRDIPPKVKEIGEFIDRLNMLATTQIAMRIDVISFFTEDSDNYGFDWGAVFSGSEDFGFEFNSSMLNSSTSNLQVGFINPTGAFNGSQAFLNALSEVVTVSNTYTGFGQTSNGVSVPILDEQTKDYVASLETDSSEVGLTTRTEIESAVTGLDMNILPKLTSRNKVSMAIKLAINDLEDLEEKNFGDNQVQLPTKSSRSLFFSPVMTPGKTYMIGGLSTKSSDSSDASITGNHGPLSWLFGGRKAAETKEEQTVILVTPYIVES